MSIHPNAFQQQITVTDKDIDELNHVNNIVYLNWVQEVSRSHWESLTTKEQREKYIWVVRRHEIDYLRPAKLGDDLVAYTWPEFSEGNSSVRHVVLQNKATGKVVMKSSTTWVLLNNSDFRPMDVPEDLKQIFAKFNLFLSSKNISLATIADATAITRLLNISYRGDTAKQGWTHEADLIGGLTRTVEDEVRGLLTTAGSVFLVYKENAEIIGCVNLKDHIGKVYLGMLAVKPLLQGSGTGKHLLHAAEEYAKHIDASAIYMTVISDRKELIDWYKRHGYVDTGKREAFPEDEVSGKHLKELEFVVLEKTLTN